MEQKSNVQYRAEKEYKNSREKFFLLLREVLSNAIHAVIIKQSKDAKFIPEIGSVSNSVSGLSPQTS